MAVNSSYSENAELEEGQTDGKYYKARQNTRPDPSLGSEITQRNREHLHADLYYGYPNRELPPSQRVLPG